MFASYSSAGVMGIAGKMQPIILELSDFGIAEFNS
jgi:hypothetical protein